LAETQPYFFNINWAFRGFMTNTATMTVKYDHTNMVMSKMKDEDVPKRLAPMDTYMRSLLNNSDEED
jgi:hypothetical protein